MVSRRYYKVLSEEELRVLDCQSYGQNLFEKSHLHPKLQKKFKGVLY